MPQFIPIPPQNIWMGINTEDEVTDIKDTETPDSRNTDISIEGELSTRSGMLKHFAVALGFPVMALLDIVREDDARLNMLILDNGSLHTY